MKIFNLKSKSFMKLIFGVFVAITFLSTAQAVESFDECTSYLETPNDYLMKAAESGSTILASIALRKGATNINDALYCASAEGKVEVVRVLLNYGADPNAKLGENGDPILRAAVCCRESTGREVIALLLDRGAEVNSCNNEGYTALMEASRDFIPDAVELLLKRGADVNKRDNRGKSALDHARDKTKLYRELAVTRKKVNSEIVARMMSTFRILHAYGA